MKKRPLCAVCVMFLIVQAVRVSFLGVEGAEPSALENAAEKAAELTLTGTVYRIEEKAKVTAVFVKDAAVTVYGHEVIMEPQILAYVRPEQRLKIGNRIRMSGEGQSFESARNPGNFNQKAYYARQGIRILIWPDYLEVLSDEVWQARQFLSDLRSSWNQLLIRHLGDYYGGTMSAVLLGEKGGLDAEMKKLYQKNGIGHLLAISGLHMSFIGTGLYSILRRCGLGFAPSGILGGCILLLYTLMIGAGVSSLRALIMFLVRIGADMTGRDYDLPTSLALSAAVLTWRQPLYLTDAGFQLSFGAILGISLLSPVFSETFGCDVFASKKKTAGMKITELESVRRRKKLLAQCGWNAAAQTAQGLSSSMAVSIFLMGPLLYFYFEVPPYSVILNLLVIPIMPAAMGAGLAGSFLALVWDPAGGAVLQVCRGVLWIYDRACAGTGMLPGSRIVTGQPKMTWLIVYYLGIGVICIVFQYLLERTPSLDEFQKGNRDSICQSPRSRQGCARGLSVRLPGLLLLLFAAGMTVSCRMGYKPAGEMQAVLLDVGQGDGIHIRGPAGNYFIDGGSSDVSQPGTYRIEPYLLANAVDTIDYAFITHGDEDHISGIRELLEAQELGIRIRCLVLPPREYHDEKLTELAALAVRNGTRAAVMEAGDVIRQAGVTFTCIGPERDAGLEPGNGASLVLDVSFGEFDMLLTGDVEGAGERALIEGGRLREYDVLKAAHHGSKNSGTEDFLEIIHPKIALISAGRDNRYGHPHKETLERLAYAGCRVYSTQESGAVTVWTDGSKVRCNSYLVQQL